ncbi:hemolysin family protein [Natronoarchaeum sp. GCM10025321]|uniref:hemolysin family protein n=1 Tax=Natronoarchaeum sp. GCM10025321 TaxID=3252684 RepID=UPI003623F455
MVDLLVSGGRLLAALFLVVLNGFFVAAEFAYVRIRSEAVDTLVEEGKAGAGQLEAAMDNLDDYLAVTQLGITIASLGLGWIGEPAVAALLDPVLAPLLPESIVHFVAFGLGFGFITFLHVVFGELAPKTIAIAQAERVALFVAAPMRAFYIVFVPGIIVFNGTANYFTRLIGIPPASESEETFTESELRTVLARAGREGNIDMEEVEMIERVFEFDDVSVREAMVPRPDVVSVPADMLASDLRTLIIEQGHTRYPVVDGSDTDQVVGFVDVKDVMRVSESSDADPVDPTAGEIAREMPVVPETTRASELLTQMQSESRQMAAIIDEWGAFEGIVTIEDLVERVVGDIRDEFDEEAREPTIDRRDDRTALADGGVTLTDVNDALDADFESDEFETIGGLVLAELGRAPEVGDEVMVRDWRLTVEDVTGTRIAAVLVQDERPDEESEDGSDGEESDDEN